MQTNGVKICQSCENLSVNRNEYRCKYKYENIYCDNTCPVLVGKDVPLKNVRYSYSVMFRKMVNGSIFIEFLFFENGKFKNSKIIKKSVR